MVFTWGGRETEARRVSQGERSREGALLGWIATHCCSQGAEQLGLWGYISSQACQRLLQPSKSHLHGFLGNLLNVEPLVGQGQRPLLPPNQLESWPGSSPTPPSPREARVEAGQVQKGSLVSPALQDMAFPNPPALLEESRVCKRHAGCLSLRLQASPRI